MILLVVVLAVVLLLVAKAWRAALQAVLDRGIASRGHFFQTEMKAYCRHMSVVEVPILYRAPSAGLGAWVLADAIRNLARLFGLRLLGRL